MLDIMWGVVLVVRDFWWCCGVVVCCILIWFVVLCRCLRGLCVMLYGCVWLGMMLWLLFVGGSVVLIGGWCLFMFVIGVC